MLGQEALHSSKIVYISTGLQRKLYELDKFIKKDMSTVVDSEKCCLVLAAGDLCGLRSRAPLRATTCREAITPRSPSFRLQQRLLQLKKPNTTWIQCITTGYCALLPATTSPPKHTCHLLQDFGYLKMLSPPLPPSLLRSRLKPPLHSGHVTWVLICLLARGTCPVIPKVSCRTQEMLLSHPEPLINSCRSLAGTEALPATCPALRDIAAGSRPGTPRLMRMAQGEPKPTISPSTATSLHSSHCMDLFE